MTFQIANFPDAKSWLEYRSKLAQRIEALLRLYNSSDEPYPFIGLDTTVKNPTNFLHLVYDWTKGFGVNPNWLLGMDDEQPVMLLDYAMSSKESADFVSICKRLLGLIHKGF